MEAEYPGKGIDGNGADTKLTYQWYLQTSAYGFSPEYPAPISGETKPILKLKKAVCEDMLQSGRHGCTGLLRYSVRVCNTFGCVRSNVVAPNITHPVLVEGETWD